MARSTGLMEAPMSACLRKTISKVTESTVGLTGESLMELGKTTKCMEVELLLGQMAENTKENILTTKNKAKELLLGQMAEHTKGNGIMENNMEPAYTL